MDQSSHAVLETEGNTNDKNRTFSMEDANWKD